jgi:KaiC/GvpD/RAD55 family RecA-like ATPase
MKGRAQDFLEVNQIKEGIMILKNKALRGVLMASSINFSLKSEEEQNATIYQFQNFLNSLDFFCQIIAQSRKINIRGYLDKIKIIENNQKNPLLKMQTADYRRFIKDLVTDNSILTKSFFIVVPYSTSESDTPRSKGLLNKPTAADLTEQDFQRHKQQIWQRMEFVVLGLRRCGVKVVPLTTIEIVEFLWALHHPKEAESGYYPEFPSDLII